MHDLLTQLLQLNLAAGAAILTVLLLRKPVRALFGARLAYGLWLAVPIAASASLAPPRPMQLLTAAAPAPLAEAAEDTTAAFWTWGAAATAPSGVDPAAATAGLWAVGLAVMIAWLAWRQQRFIDLMRHGSAGPAVVGFLRPRIITPNDFEERFDRREQTVVLAHERIHLARHDARLNALVALARCVCWFNPLVHVFAHVMRVDQELSCDATVVERHPKARAPYAQALLKAQLAARPLPLGCYWPAGTEHPLTERIAMLKQSNPSRARRLTGSAVIAALTVGAGYAAWAAAPVTAPAAAAPVAYIEATAAPDVVEIASLAPTPESAVKAPAHKPSRSEQLAAADPAAMTDTCLTNACANPAPPAEPQSGSIANRVLYVGTAPLPSFTPFARYFDGNSPVLIRGKVAEVRMSDGWQAELMVQAQDGKFYRVMGGDPAGLTPELRARVAALVGQTIDVRGYLGHDKTCEGGCLVNGRDVTFTDGAKILSR